MKTLILLLLLPLLTFAQESVKPWIGVHIDKGDKGVLIKKAVQNTPAARAGFKTGDEILSVDKKKVQTPEELIHVVRSKGVGHKVTIKYLEAGKKEKQTVLELEAMPGMTEMAEKNLLNKKAPDFKTKILSHKDVPEYQLSKDLGQVKIIEFWATWCGACVQAHPIIDQFAKQNPNIKILAISREEPVKIKKYLARAKKEKTSSGKVYFLKGKDTKVNEDYFVPALPMFILLDKKNIVRHLAIGTGQNLMDVFKKAQKLATEKIK